MGKESRIRQERKQGLIEKPTIEKHDRFPIVMRIIVIILVVALGTWGSLFAVKSTTGGIAYQVGKDTVLQSDIDSTVENYVTMYKQYGLDLTSSEYASTLKSIRKNVTESSIEQELFVQYAQAKGIKLDQAKLKAAVDKELDSAVKQSQQSFTSTKDFEDAAIAQYGSMDKYKAFLRTKIQPHIEKQQLAEAVTTEVDNSVKVSDADVKAYFTSEGKVEAEHLLITVDADNDSSAAIAAKKRTAQSIYDDIVKQKAAQGASFDFAKYAQNKATELNKKTSGAAQYESLGWFTKGQMVAEFETAAFAAKAGDIVGPVKTDYGYHIIHIIATAPVSAIYDTAAKVKASHIVFTFTSGSKTDTQAAALALANKVYAQLQKGLSFKSAIAKYSKDSDAKTGGILDYFAETDNTIRFDALQTLKPGQYTKPILNGSSYEILRLTDRKAEIKAKLTDKATYDKVKTALLSERKKQASDNLIAELKKQYPVRQGRWASFTASYNKGIGKFFNAIGQWFVKATGKGSSTTTTPSSTSTSPSAQ